MVLLKLCHLGFIKALEEKGIQPHFIAGSSIGSIVGALWASGLKASEIIDIFKQIDSRNFLKYISFSISRVGFVDTRIEDFEKSYRRYNLQRFEDTIDSFGN